LENKESTILWRLKEIKTRPKPDYRIIMFSLSNTVVAASTNDVTFAGGTIAASVGVAEASTTSRNDVGYSHLSLPEDSSNQKSLVAILAQELNGLSFGRSY
jgi:hypothetical protein